MNGIKLGGSHVIEKPNGKREFSKQATDNIEVAVQTIINSIGGNIDSEGLKETPKRVAKMYAEMFEGMLYTNKDIANMFDKCFEEGISNDLVVIRDIPVFSNCEHHLALMYNMTVSVAYLPNNKVIGLSKVGRISDMVAKRLQLQERIGRDIADVLELILGTDDILVVIEGEHACMTARGIKSRGSKTKTATALGQFRDNSKLRAEAYELIK